MTAFALADAVIRDAVAARVFPAATVEVGMRGAVAWRAAFGRLSYDDRAPETTIDTVFDLASLTKVIATATLAMRAVDEDLIQLDDPVAQWIPEWRGADRSSVTLRDLLEHSSGLTAYLPFFRDHTGRAEFQQAISTLPLEYAPRSRAVYSDLGFILLAFILEDARALASSARTHGAFDAQAHIRGAVSAHRFAHHGPAADVHSASGTGATASPQRNTIPGAGGRSSAKCMMRMPGRSEGRPATPACSGPLLRSGHSRARCCTPFTMSPSWRALTR